MYWAYAVIIGMMVYVAGGNTYNGDAVEHVYRFDIENNKWDNNLPPLNCHHCVPVVLEGKLSVIGGRESRSRLISNKVNTYNEDSNQWVAIYPDMNQPRYRPAVVTNKIHVIVLGGKIKERSKLTDSIEVMNVKNKQWITLNTHLPNKMYDVSVTIADGLIWIVGYDNGKKRSNEVVTISVNDLIYQTTEKHSWKVLNIRSNEAYFKTAVSISSDFLVFFGGFDQQNKAISSVMVFNPKTHSWNEVAALSSPRAHCAVAQLPGGRGMIVIGGCRMAKDHSQCSSSCLQTTEVYYISSKYIFIATYILHCNLIINF